jgi:hypothetical protein
VAVVALGGAVAVDLFDGPRRLARVPVPGASSPGELLALTPLRDAIRVRWRNPDGRAVTRRVDVPATAVS